MEIRHRVQLCDAKMLCDTKRKVPNEDRCRDVDLPLIENSVNKSKTRKKP